ncbi:MAG: response regulator transcription factor, partial [Actinomycetota bacterium]|nr:response regulator transcription factor [Actinomycetota bacterium]
PEIVRGIRAAAAGGSLIAPSVAGNLLTRLRHHGPPDAQPTSSAFELSPRELDVLRLVVAGRDNNEIAKRLHLSASTVKHHVSSTLDKLGVENRIQAAVLAVRLGLVDEAEVTSG